MTRAPRDYARPDAERAASARTGRLSVASASLRSHLQERDVAQILVIPCRANI